MSAKNLIPILLLPLAVLAKSYHYPEIRTEVELLANGDARVRQERTYAFRGSFSWAFVDIRKAGADDIEFHSLSELTDRGESRITPLELTNGLKSLYVKWGYSAHDEEKTFVLDYTVKGVVKRYADAADFYWKVIEDEHEPVGRAGVSVSLPAGSADLFKVYVHSRARPGSLELDPDAGFARIEQTGIPKNAFVEVRVLSHPDLYPQARLTPEERYARILAEEKRNFLLSTLGTYALLPVGLLIILVAPLVLLIAFYRRHGREPRLDYDAVYEREPPRLAPPVAVPRMMSQKPDRSALGAKVFEGMFATLLQLAGKGLVVVEEEKPGRKPSYVFRFKPGADRVSVDGLGREVLDFFFTRVARGDVLTEKMLKDYGKSHSTEAQKFLADLGDRTGEWWERELGAPLLDPASTKAHGRFVGLSLLAIAFGVLVTVPGFRSLSGAPGGLSVAIPAGFGVLCFAVYAVLGRVIHRWDPQAYLEHLRWLRFRRFLTEFSAIEQAPLTLLGIWEQYYVYATALGVAKEFLKNITRLAQQRNAELALPAWYAGAAARGQFQGASLAESFAGFQSFATNFQSMVSSFSASSSSGGGFSGGGGGGGGGGSSGAG